MKDVNTLEKLPEDILELQKIITGLLSEIADKQNKLKEQHAEIADNQNKLKEQYAEIEYLRHKLQSQLAARFASKSEKHQFQADLFDEASPPEQEEINVVEAADEEITVAAHTRKKTGRKPLPKDLPREQIIHDITDEEKICSCGCEKHKIGEDKSEQLEWIPAQVKVIEHVRIKYGCRNCVDGTVTTAPAPKLPISKSIATPGLLSEIIISKYADHLPLYRQEQILQRMGIDITRATLSTWIIKCSELLYPLIDLQKQYIISHKYIQADETTLQVLNEPGKNNTSKSYMWVFNGGTPEKRAVVFQYNPTRSGEVATRFLENYIGALQSDAYSGYMQFKDSLYIQLYLCWAHARRKFADIVKVNNKKPGKAHMAINFIAKLYAVEKVARTECYTFSQRQNIRQEKALPLLNQFKDWLDKSYQTVPPKSPIGEAIAYTLNNWTELIKYINNGEVEIDNNIVENLIRPFALGRKNWLFCGSPEGAKAGAAIYSLLQSCKLNSIEPYAYFKCVLANIRSYDKNKLSELLPHNIEPGLLIKAYTDSFLRQE
ncbi:MAG: IS66 family transposase [Rickettsiaceae bacterium]|nr:IS66 family transposase [Rickettsiaceae bacterium]